MIRIPSLTPRELVKILRTAGFEDHHQTGSHLTLKNTETGLRVVVPIHRRDLKRGTLNGILKQAGLDRTDIEDLLRK